MPFVCSPYSDRCNIPWLLWSDWCSHSLMSNIDVNDASEFDELDDVAFENVDEK